MIRRLAPRSPAGNRLLMPLIVFALTGAFAAAPSLAPATPAAAQVAVILDTDIGGDADDLGALAMLHHLADRGECEILGVVSVSAEAYAVAAIHAVNRYYGHPDIPIAGRKDGIWHEPWQYNRPVAEALGSRLDPRDVPAPTALYRRILAEQPDSGVTLVTVGPLLNIRRLLESGPDAVSPLSGRQLVIQKVREVVIMGGEFPVGEGEWNFDADMPGVTRWVLDRLEPPVVFSGYEVGNRIRTGRGLNRLDRSSPLYIGYRHFGEHAPWVEEEFAGEILDNASYDQTAVLYAVRGGVGTYWNRVRGGRVEVDENGDNRWIPGPVTNQSYLELIADPDAVAAVIEALMLGDV